MGLGNVVEEEFTLRGELTWIRESGVENVARREQSLDLVFIQKRDGKSHSIWNISEPGFQMFSALLNYYHTITGELPPIEDVQHVLDQHTKSKKSGFPVDKFGMRNAVEENIVEIKDGKVVSTLENRTLSIGFYEDGLKYEGFIENRNLVIFTDQGTKPEFELGIKKVDGEYRKIEGNWTREAIIDTEDALRIMKVVYFHARDKTPLEDIYRFAQDTYSKKEQT